MQSFHTKTTDQYQVIDLASIPVKEKINRLINQEKWSEAQQLAAGVEHENSSDIELLMMISEVFTKTNDFPAALKVFHQMLDILNEKDPKIFEVYKNMGNLYLKCGDIEAAEEKYNLANAINSQDENLIINYGVLAIQKGSYDEAKSRFAQVIAVNSASDLAWVGIGLVHRAHADHDLARACLLRGIDENPYNKLAITNYYQWCYQDGVDFTDQFINRYLEKFPEDKEVMKLASGIHQ